METFDEAENSMIGKRVGVYKLREEIGRGGMGAVYLAERADGEFHQRVAIKLIKRGMDTDLILKRFRRERQIVAALDHPNIAYFLSGGSTANGLPYFVMEFVEGKPLYEFCDENKLSIEKRLEIFRQVCEAVHAAHEKKVIHRDLKPSNILVKRDGTPKLLDFGIAKVLDPDLSFTEIDPTATEMRVMTPEYASPEQVSDNEITTRSDIYSLGVILYEILTGYRPYKLKRRVPFEVARIICEEYPPSASQPKYDAEMQIPALKFISQNGNPAAEIENSKFQIQKLKFDELDRIVHKTLRKNPAERYATASELSADIKNFLEGQTVKAEAFETKSFNFKKSDEKKSVAILPFNVISTSEILENTGDSILGVGLIDALILRLSGVRRLVLRPTSTVLRFSEHEDPFEVGNKLSVDFAVAGNIRRVGERLRVTAQLLDIDEGSTVWSASFDEKTADVLELEDLLSEKIAESLLPKLSGEERKILDKRGTNSHEAFEAYLRGRAYWNLQSEDGFARAINFYRQAVEYDPAYAQAWIAIAEYYIFLGIHCVIPFGESVNATREAAEKAVRLDPTLAEGYATLGFVAGSWKFAWQEAEELFEKALEINPNSLMANFWNAALFAQTGRFEEAFELIKRMYEFDPHSLLAVHLRAWVLYHSRDFDESVKVYEKMLEAEPNYAWGIQGYSWVLRKVGRFDEAIEQAAEAVSLTGRIPIYLMALAAAYADAGESEKASEILAELEEIAETKFVSDYMLAHVFLALGDKDKTFELLEKSLGARDDWMRWLGVDPQFDSLYGDPRFEDLLRRTGNPLAEPANSDTKIRKTLTDKANKRKSIAVLPLRIIGESFGDEEYLSVGLADAMITRLSNVRRIIVRPTAAVLRFAEATDAIEAGRELETDFVLSGTIRRAGERIRISAQLAEIKTETVLWADKFNEEIKDILDLEDAVAEKIGDLLVPQITGEEQRKLSKRGTNNPQAYEAYLKARYNLYQLTPDAYTAAKNYFEEAIRLDPDYALAYVGLADYYFALTTFGTMPPLKALTKSRQLAEKALRFDKSLGEAYTVLGFVCYGDFNFGQMEKNLRHGIELNPNNPLAHIWLSCILTLHGKSEEAFAEAARAVEINPVSLFDRYHEAWIFYHHRHFEKAARIAESLLETEPNYSHGLAVYSRIIDACGNFAASLDAARRAFELNAELPWIGANYAAALARNGEREEARKILHELENLPAEIYVTPYCLAVAHLQLGDREKVFELLEKAFETRDIWINWLATDPQLDSLHGDARYRNLLDRLLKK